MNDVRARGPPPSLELGILGSFLTRLNFRFYQSPSEIMGRGGGGGVSGEEG